METELDPELRRLPVYMVLDCSASMSGPPIEAVKEGLKMLLRDLANEPWSQGTLWLSIITFNSSAQVAVPLTEISHIAEPKLVATGQTALGSALRTLHEQMDKELRQRTAEHRGDYRPIVYLLTDGRPTDSAWEQEAQEIRRRKVDNFIACAAGPEADEQMLRKLTEKVVRLQDASPESLKAFIKWVSQSVQVRSRSIAAGVGAPEEPPLPAGAEAVVTEHADRTGTEASALSPSGVSRTL